MPQHLLHGAQIGAMVEQMAGEGMAQHMRRQPNRIEPGGNGELFQQLTAALSRQMPGAAARREEPAGRPSVRKEAIATFEIGAEGQPARFAQRDDALLAALAGHQQETRVAPCRGEGQRHELGNPEPRRIEQLEYTAQADTFISGPDTGGVYQRLDLGFRQYFWQGAAESRRVELCRRVVLPQAFDQEEFVELSHRRDAASERP